MVQYITILTKRWIFCGFRCATTSPITVLYTSFFFTFLLYTAKTLVQVHVQETCHCFDVSLPLIKGDPDMLPCRTIDFPTQCSESPDDTGPCVDALMKYYERVTCAKKVQTSMKVSWNSITIIIIILFVHKIISYKYDSWQHTNRTDKAG